MRSGPETRFMDYSFPPQLDDHIDLSKGAAKLLEVTSKNMAVLKNQKFNGLLVATLAAREVSAVDAFEAPKRTFTLTFDKYRTTK